MVALQKMLLSTLLFGVNIQLYIQNVCDTFYKHTHHNDMERSMTCRSIFEVKNAVVTKKRGVTLNMKIGTNSKVFIAK